MAKELALLAKELLLLAKELLLLAKELSALIYGSALTLRCYVSPPDFRIDGKDVKVRNTIPQTSSILL